MYYMKDVCKKVGISYETLKFYCNRGLVPNLKRDKNNYRIFDDNDVEWIKKLCILKDCGLSIREIQDFCKLVIRGDSTIPERMQTLLKRRKLIEEDIRKMNKNLEFIDYWVNYYEKKK